MRAGIFTAGGFVALAGYCMWLKVSSRWSASRLRARAFGEMSSATCVALSSESSRTQPKPRAASKPRPVSAV